MRSPEKKIAGILRIVFASLILLAQLFVLFLLVINLKQMFVYVYFLLELIGLAEVLILIDRNRGSSYTIAWIVTILVLPVFGVLLYYLWGRAGTRSRCARKTRQILSRLGKWLTPDPEAQLELQRSHSSRKRLSVYLEKEGFPLYQGTQSRYYPLGELQFEDMIADLEQARRFIFMEYYIVSDGRLWERIYEVLRRKAAQGVEIRILYDDVGSIFALPDEIKGHAEKDGIKTLAFNPVHRYVNRLYVNYRNHQKITIMDGGIAYTGGTNIADEYVNLYSKYGHWKDTAIRLEGDAVWSLTVAFLQMWEVESGASEDYGQFRPDRTVAGDGFYQPFTDGPVNEPDNPAEATYRYMITNAQDYVYITTPYLVVDNAMLEVLSMAALSGTDVRIVTPKIPDHSYVHAVTRFNYGRLMEAGIRIYEYTPGYIHAKTILSDDDHAITGSINMDYRSFHLHFENGIWICGSPVLMDIKKDILETFEVSEEITMEQWQARSWSVKLLQAFLRLFAPLF